MTMTPIRRAALSPLGIIASGLTLSVAAAHAQGAPSRASTKPWRASSTVEIATGYDDNIFLLADSKLDNLRTPSASSRMSGRYTDMESGGDLVTTLRAAAEFKGSGVAGRPMRLAPEIEYDAYARNAKRRNASVSLAADHSLPHHGELRLRAGMTPSYFAKNYLADALDRNGDGSIASSERIYAAGTYAEREISVDYRLRVAKSTKAHPFGAAVSLEAGYYGRSYKAPFAARDLSGPTVTLALPFDLTRRFAVEVNYERLQLAATPTRSVLLLDETQFNRDFNGNGTATDQSARAFEMVDRTRTENNAGVEARYELMPHLDVRINYERRSRDYGSAEPYDIANNGRRDSRNEFGFELGWHVMHGLQATAAVRSSAQMLNRENDPGAIGEVDDYHRKQFRLGLARQF